MPLRACLLAVLVAALTLPASASAIVGGAPATRAHPAMAALEKDGRLRCGASLVAPSWVLTAAHCVADVASGLTVQLGAPVRSRGGERIAVAQAIVHERFGDPDPSSNDIALLRLARPSAQTPIRLATQAERAIWGPGQRATIIGWGATATAASDATDVLRETTVPIVSDGACAGSYRFTFGFDPNSMLCAGELLGLRDTCSGDSGGPLMVADATGALVQAGVVSFGLGCGFPTQYGVYARVAGAALGDWIAPRIASPVRAVAPAAAPARATPARLRIARVKRPAGRRVTARLSTTAGVRSVRATLVRLGARGRRTVLSRASRKRVSSRATLRLTVRRRGSLRGVLRVQVTARDGAGRRVSASRRVR